MLVEVHLLGTASLIQNRRTPQSGVPIPSLSTPLQRAEDRTYRDLTGALCLQARAVKALMIGAARRPACAALGITPDHVHTGLRVVGDTMRLYRPDGSTPLYEFEVDTRDVGLGRMGRGSRDCPSVPAWSACVHVRDISAGFSVCDINLLLAVGGAEIGFGDRRAELGGRHGTFEVTGIHQVVPRRPSEVR